MKIHEISLLKHFACIMCTIRHHDSLLNQLLLTLLPILIKYNESLQMPDLLNKIQNHFNNKTQLHSHDNFQTSFDYHLYQKLPPSYMT